VRLDIARTSLAPSRVRVAEPEAWHRALGLPRDSPLDLGSLWTNSTPRVATVRQTGTRSLIHHLAGHDHEIDEQVTRHQGPDAVREEP
jgi:hypothetical protein